MMGEHELVERFRRLHITTSSDEDFKTSANSLLDQIIAYAHMSKDEICEERASNIISEQVRTLEEKSVNYWCFI